MRLSSDTKGCGKAKSPGGQLIETIKFQKWSHKDFKFNLNTYDRKPMEARVPSWRFTGPKKSLGAKIGIRSLIHGYIYPMYYKQPKQDSKSKQDCRHFHAYPCSSLVSLGTTTVDRWAVLDMGRACHCGNSNLAEGVSFLPRYQISCAWVNLSSRMSR